MRVALATCAALPDGPRGETSLVPALAAHGLAAEWRVWDDRPALRGGVRLSPQGETAPVRDDGSGLTAAEAMCADDLLAPLTPRSGSTGAPGSADRLARGLARRASRGGARDTP